MTPRNAFTLPQCFLAMVCLGLLANPIHHCAAAGRIVVAHDDLILADGGFHAPSDPGRFVQNVAAWFTGGRPGRFLAFTDNQGMTGANLVQSMTSAGHVWVVSTATPLALSNLLTFDGVFLCGHPVATDDLLAYVNAGGNVYVAGLGVADDDMAKWNSFLKHFGLGFANEGTGVADFPIGSSHTIFDGVDHLYGVNGTGVVDLEPGNPINRVVARTGTTGLFAVWGLEKAQLLIRTSQVEICWNTETNASYGIQYHSELTTNRWVPLGTNCFQGDGTIRCIYDDVPVGEGQRFYRMVTNCTAQPGALLPN